MSLLDASTAIAYGIGVLRDSPNTPVAVVLVQSIEPSLLYATTGTSIASPLTADGTDH